MSRFLPRSRQRVFATAESRREAQSDEVEREVVIKKTVHNVNMTNLSDTAVSASYDTSASRYAVTPLIYRNSCRD